jgi:GT2 family glycosyltransferase
MSLAAKGVGDLAGAATDRTPRDEGDGGTGPAPTVSVVVASRNRRHLLRRFVSAVAQDAAATEVLVVLDGDVDGSYAQVEELRAEYPKVRPVTTEGVGQMAALQLGVQASTGDVVLLMDDDVMAGPGLVSAHAQHHAGTHGLVVVGFMPIRLVEGSSSPTRLYASEYEEHCRRVEAGELTVLDGLWLGNVSVRRDEVLRVGVASERFGVRWHADTDFGLRLRAAGARGLFDRRLVATHVHSQSAASFLANAHERGEGTWLLETEHADAPDRVRPAPVLDGLSRPMRVVVSLLGRPRCSGWSSRALMGLSAAADRLRQRALSVRVAQLARRIEIACGYRCAARTHRTHGAHGVGAAGGEPAPTPAYASSSTKSGR